MWDRVALTDGTEALYAVVLVTAFEPQPRRPSAHDRLCAVGHLQLTVDVRDVVAHRFEAD